MSCSSRLKLMKPIFCCCCAKHVDLFNNLNKTKKTSHNRTEPICYKYDEMTHVSVRDYIVVHCTSHGFERDRKGLVSAGTHCTTAT